MRFSLPVPQGWLVRPLGSAVVGTVTPGQAPVVKFTVQPPLYATTTSSVLYATVGLGGTTVRQGGATVTVTG